jgi:hypothetical protein
MFFVFLSGIVQKLKFLNNFIIKKEPGAVIDIPLGAMFRRVNAIEYKSPGDHLSIADYHKAGAYVRLYGVLNKVELRDMTLSFVAES